MDFQFRFDKQCELIRNANRRRDVKRNASRRQATKHTKYRRIAKPDRAAFQNAATFRLTPVFYGNNRHFSEVLIEVNLVFSFVPIPFTTDMMTSAMPAASSPYSMAVAPDWSAQNLRTVAIMRRRCAQPLKHR
jgi:hypothetical protein